MADFPISVMYLISLDDPTKQDCVILTTCRPTRSGALFKPTAPLGVETTGRSEDEIKYIAEIGNQSSVGGRSL